MSFARNIAVLGALAALPGLAMAQTGNDILATNGAEVVFIFSDPSNGGAAPGSISAADDLAWNATPAFLAGSVGGTTVELDTLETIFVGTSDWPAQAAIGGPPIYDISLGSATPVSGIGTDSTYIPDFFSTGSVSVLISLGLSGLPNPCSIPTSPSVCPTPGCPPPITGFNVDILIGTGPGSGVIYTSDPTAASGPGNGTAATYFLPGGMPFTGTSAGSCGLGNYNFTAAHSTNENQADAAPAGSGNSFLSGFQVGGMTPTGPIPEGTDTLQEVEFGYEGNMIEASTADVGYGPESGLSSVMLSAASGTATLGAVVHDLTGVGGLVLAAASTSNIGISGGFGLPGFGPEAFLSLTPTSPIFNSTFAAWAGTGVVVGIDEDGDTIADEGEAATILLPIPAAAAGVSLHLQAFVIASFGPIVADATSSFEAKVR